MIKLSHLTKCFNALVAVNDVCLEVAPGELFGFLGPNGAGKTTTIRIMAGLIQPSSGSAVIDSWDIARNPVEAKQITGFIPDRPYLYGKLTAQEFLRFISGLYHVPPEDTEGRIAQLLELFNLTPWGDELIEGFSHGMKQRLVMSSALIHKPRVLIVDEPMVGLDPAGVKLVKRIFRGLCEAGVTVFMSTHTLEIAEEMCDRIGIIQDGRLIAVGNVKELKEMAGAVGKRLEEIFFKLTGAEELGELVETLRP
jgi:ABC-2 type transport system ATP-binding protein